MPEVKDDVTVFTPTLSLCPLGAAAGRMGGEGKALVGWSVAKATLLPGYEKAAAGLYPLETRVGFHFRRRAEITHI